MRIKVISITPLEQKFKTVYVGDEEKQVFDCLVPICDTLKHRKIYDGENLETIKQDIANEFKCYDVDLNYDPIDPPTVKECMDITEKYIEKLLKVK